MPILGFLEVPDPEFGFRPLQSTNRSFSEKKVQNRIDRSESSHTCIPLLI
jgi:hypothetical protein